MLANLPVLEAASVPTSGAAGMPHSQPIALLLMCSLHKLERQRLLLKLLFRSEGRSSGLDATMQK